MNNSFNIQLASNIDAVILMWQEKVCKKNVVEVITNTKVVGSVLDLQLAVYVGQICFTNDLKIQNYFLRKWIKNGPSFKSCGSEKNITDFEM